MSDKIKGRPKEPFKPWSDWQDDILNLYSEGASDVEIRGLIIENTKDRETLHFDLWTRWLDEEQLFSETIKNGRQLSQIWWERNGRVNLKESAFNSTLWYMNMKNRFGWADRQEINANVKQQVTDLDDEALTEEIEDLQRQLDEANNE